eukprot:TRINITY_DN94441_c0_g1_i1.p1 TRINITY_DN94441_c0_g1~~TRINITY_DN94441_c0_g1_i1.p1  ORF type:complete len:382 (+),score=45.46 TRINITY_DN94441_c0_g1_i1:40-1185(+)
MDLLPLAAPPGGDLATHRGALSPFSALLGQHARLVPLSGGADISIAMKLWADLGVVLREMEVELKRFVAPAPFGGRSLRFQARDGATVQTLSEGHFSYCHFVGSRRPIVYEGALGSGTSEYDWDSAANGAPKVKIYARVRFTLGFYEGAWVLEAIERGRFPMHFAMTPASDPAHATVTPDWGVPRTYPWCQQLPRSRSSRGSEQTPKSASRRNVPTSPAWSLDGARRQTEGATQRLGLSKASFGTTKSMGGALAAASAAVLYAQEVCYKPGAHAQHTAILHNAVERQRRAAGISKEVRRNWLFKSGAAEKESESLSSLACGATSSALDGWTGQESPIPESGPSVPIHLRMQALELNLKRNQAHLQLMRPHLNEVLVSAPGQ